MRTVGISTCIIINITDIIATLIAFLAYVILRELSRKIKN